MFRRAALATAFVLATSIPALAGTIYDFYATSQFPSDISDFSLKFDDTSGDGLLQVGEIVVGSFLGPTYSGIGSAISLLCVPNTSLSTGSCSGNLWYFNNFSANTATWTYAVTPVSAVPLPAPLLLLAAALGALGLGGWWRKRAAVHFRPAISTRR